MNDLMQKINDKLKDRRHYYVELISGRPSEFKELCEIYSEMYELHGYFISNMSNLNSGIVDGCYILSQTFVFTDESFN